MQQINWRFSPHLLPTSLHFLLHKKIGKEQTREKVLQEFSNSLVTIDKNVCKIRIKKIWEDFKNLNGGRITDEQAIWASLKYKIECK